MEYNEELKGLVKELIDAIDDYENDTFKMDYEKEDDYYRMISLKDDIKLAMDKLK